MNLENLNQDLMAVILESGYISYADYLTLGLVNKTWHQFIFKSQASITCLRKCVSKITDLKNFDLGSISNEELFSMVKDMAIKDLATSAINRGDNIFVTGPAGSGKTHFLNKICQNFNPSKGEYNCGSTGCASTILVNGRTFHNLFSSIAVYNFGEKKDNDCQYIVDMAQKKIKSLEQNSDESTKWKQRWKSGYNKTTNRQKLEMLQKIKKIRLDEVSMTSMAFFRYIHECMTRINFCNKPFGGVQLILSGDFCQLKPVPEKGNSDTAAFVYKSSFWDKIKVFKLNFSFRQCGDKEWTNVCNEIRFGNVSKKTIEIINSRRVKEGQDQLDEEATYVFSTNKEVDDHNNMMLSRNKNKEITLKRSYEIKKSCRNDTSICQIPKESDPEKFKDFLLKRTDLRESVTFKKDGRVMVTKNVDVSIGLVNGTDGRVLKYDPVEKTISLRSVFNKKVVKYKISAYESNIIDPCGCHIEVRGWPVRLSYAITIYKCQGATLPKIKAQVKKDISHAELYTLVTRAPSRESITFPPYFSLNIKQQDPEVKAFYSPKKEKDDTMKLEPLTKKQFEDKFRNFIQKETNSIVPLKKLKQEVVVIDE